MAPTFEPAALADLPVIRAVLAASDLPVDDIDQHLDRFILARVDGRTIGMVAVEYAGEAALLRSLCVVPEYRGQSVGSCLIAAIEAIVASHGVLELYLLTETAAAFFERRGFSRVTRELAHAGIQTKAQFRGLCPSTAVCMHKPLRSNAALGFSLDVPAAR